ncbi:MAG TPA: sulfurtransferase TusA family protein [Nitrospiria bacterium]|nr:sulfurtransferase TusA family protein [Nitrospiria bacterium]
MTPPNSLELTKPASRSLPGEIEKEIEAFEAQVEKVRQGKITLDQFRPFRLQYGVYGQRQPNVQMFRIKIPYGGISADQLDRVADVADTYSDGVLHATTRQDIQLHWISLYKCGEIMRKICEAGLTTREACGNTVRNVTGCPRAGVCHTELFDITPYAAAVSRYLLRNPVCQSMPRKFKISFSGCPSDCALPGIHDLGMVAAVKKLEDGREERGFQVFAGGGLGAMPRIAHLLETFIPTTELTRVCEAVIKVFDRFGNRKNRNRARLKFVIDKLGMNQFNKLYREEFEKLRANAEAALQLPVVQEGQIQLHSGNGEKSPLPVHDAGNGKLPASYAEWLKTNVEDQKQEGFALVQIRLRLGDIHAEKAKQVAEIARTFAGGFLRITINQNFILRWVKKESLPALYEALKKAGLEEAGAETLRDIVSCPGADTCGIAITSSKQMALALSRQFEKAEFLKPEYDGLRIKISGCQNSCSQHHISPIGLHGVSKTIGGKTAPFYELHLGGRTDEKGTTMGKVIGKVPARNVPDVVKKVLSLYTDQRQEGETFPAFTDRIGKKKFSEEISDLLKLPSFEETPSYYYDWGGHREFEVLDLGPGECAGGAETMVKEGFEEADSELSMARESVEKNQGAFALSKAHRAVQAGIRAMLVLKGVEPANDTDALTAFEEHYLHTPSFHEKFPDFKSFAEKLERGGHPAAEEVKTDIQKAGAFLEECRILFALSDTNDKAAPSGNGKSPAVEAKPEEKKTEPAHPEPFVPTAKMDLRGVKCPINFVRTKLKLEMMESGETLEVLLDEGEPAANVPRSVKDEGHQVLDLAQVEHYFKLMIKKA